MKDNEIELRRVEAEMKTQLTAADQSSEVTDQVTAGAFLLWITG